MGPTLLALLLRRNVRSDLADDDSPRPRPRRVVVVVVVVCAQGILDALSDDTSEFDRIRAELAAAPMPRQDKQLLPSHS